MSTKIVSFDVGMRNMAYCIIDGSGIVPKILEWELIDIGKHSCIEHAIVRLTKELKTKFDSMIDLTTVLIERQPKTRSVMMVSLQMGICAYFANKKLEGHVANNVNFMSAKHKLSMREYTKTDDDKPRQIKPRGNKPDTAKRVKERENSSRYSANKRYAINATKHYLANILEDKENLAKLLKSKKKDDFSDSFLQAVSYLER